MAGNCGQNIGSTRPAGGSRGHHLAPWMHQPAVTDWREQEGKRKIEAQDPRAQVALLDRDRVARPKRDIVKDSAIFPERDLALRAAVEIIKYRLGNSLASDRAKVLDAHHARGRHRSRGDRHYYGSRINEPRNSRIWYHSAKGMRNGKLSVVTSKRD